LQIDWAVTCRYAESDGIVGTLVGAGIDLLYVPQLPHPVSVMLAVRLSATFEEVSEGQRHEIVGRILGPEGSPLRNPDGSEVPPLTVNFQAGGATQVVSGWLISPLFAFGFQWLATDEGTYTVQVRVGDGVPSLSPVHVLTAPGTSGT
jgi:hypothetical protein